MLDSAAQSDIRDEEPNQVMALLHQAKLLARQYYELTGKPLGVTGEIAEYEAARILGLTLHPARTAGYDATEVRDGKPYKIQIKGRCITKQNTRIAGRLGSINLKQEFDGVMLVLLDHEFNAFAIYEAPRSLCEEMIMAEGSVARNERGALAISQFKSRGTLRWSRPQHG
ncbi:TPA: hypothetical protein ACQQJB_003608 [Pseudomonas aeruginosa]